MACNTTLFLIILYFIFNNTNADSTTDSCNFLSDDIYIHIFDIILFEKNHTLLGYTEDGNLCLAFSYDGQEYSKGQCRYDYFIGKSWCAIGNLNWGWCDENSACIHGM